MTISVFLSHARAASTKPESRTLRKCLERLHSEHAIDLFVDDTSIGPGEGWPARLADEITKRDLVVLALSAEFHVSEWCQEEMQRAIAGDKAVPVLLESTYLPDILSQVQSLPVKDKQLRPVTDFKDGSEEIYAQMKRAFEEFNNERKQSDKEIKQPARFGVVAQRIRKNLGSAHSFWLLTKTGQGWWTNFYDLFKQITDKNRDSRVLLLNPDSKAFGNPNVVWNKLGTYKQNAKQKIEELARENLELRVIDAPMPFALLILLLNEKPCVVFMEDLKLKDGATSSRIRQFDFSTDRALCDDLFNTFVAVWEKYGSPRNSAQDRDLE